MWNQTLDAGREEREIVPRDRMFASELWKADVDIWLNMMGETPTNPPNSRSKRKFEAGNIWEWIVRLVLLRAGILVADQTPVKSNLPGCIEVSGKLDFHAGGKPDFAKGMEELELLNSLAPLPDMIYRQTKEMLLFFSANYPDGLTPKILEIKSVSSFAFDVVEQSEKALGGHDLQTFHYAHFLQEEAAIVYICRDDARMIEIPILPNDQGLLERYKEKVERVTDFYKHGQRPPLEPLVLFNEETGKFSKNLKVEYSSFLYQLYGYERPDQYSDEFSRSVIRWNAVLKRVRDGKEMTKNNLEAIEEMKKYFDADEIITKIKQQ